MQTQLIGFALVCLAGVAGGVFAFPLRANKVYAEENTLLLSYLVALVIIPFIVAACALPHWFADFSSLPMRQLIIPFLCGLGWGGAILAYAQGIARVGLALTVSTVMSLTIALGSIIPLLGRWGSVQPVVRGWVLAGIGVCVLGVILFGAAGLVRDRGHSTATRGSFFTGFLWCVVSGLLSPLANIGFDAAAPVVDQAVSRGGNAQIATMLAWFPTWAGGLIIVIVVMVTRLVKNRTAARFVSRRSLPDLLRTCLMGVLHFLGQVPYGIGAFFLGVLGTSVGWAATLGSQLIVANGLGIAMGEWKGTPRACARFLAAGMGIVIVAIVMLAYASSLSTRS
jgi:L-rhamnose-H+ transport protein